MIKVLNLKQSRKLDELSIRENTNLDTLIDSAGKALCLHIIENISTPFEKEILCISGIGNNGMDAIVCNYYLNKNNINSRLLIINPENIHHKYLEKYTLDVDLINLDNLNDISCYDYIVDGLLGTGLNRDIEGVYFNVINKIKEHNNIISIDVPSGIYTDSGRAANNYINAKQTVTFTYPKLCHFLTDGYSSTGDLHVYQIGHSKKGLDDININVIEKEDIYKKTKPKNKTINKYSDSRTITLCGSKEYTGALLLSSVAAMRAGVKILKKIIPLSLAEISCQQLESIDILIEDNDKGYLGLEKYNDVTVELTWADTLLIGPGLNDNHDSISLISRILSEYSGICVIDAAVFKAMSSGELMFENIPEYSILTPHQGEFLRILGVSSEEFQNDTIRILDDFSKKLCNRVLVLKGPNTIIMNGKGDKFIISNGNSLLSTAGTGDVLSGIITAYVSNGYTLLDSAIIGSYIHAECSKYLDNQMNDNIIASDLLPIIPKIQYSIRNYKNED